MKEKLRRFMMGRYGVDYFSRFTLTASLIFLILSTLTKFSLFQLLFWGFLLYTYYRIFSRNIAKRREENNWYLNKTYKTRNFILRQKNSLAQRKTHHIYKCPNCKQKIRVPRGKGKIEITCPKCRISFIKRSQKGALCLDILPLIKAK